MSTFPIKVENISSHFDPKYKVIYCETQYKASQLENTRWHFEI